MSASTTSVADVQHSLNPGTLGWLSVAALGVAIAISGNFSGWNYGLGLGGLGGMLVAALCMVLFYFGLTQCVAEMASTLHEEAGFDGYARKLLGSSAGFVCGMAVAVAVSGGAGLILSFIDAYAQAALGVGGWGLKLGVIAVVLIVQLRGARDAVATTMVVGGIALLVLLAYCAFIAPTFQLEHWRHVGEGAHASGLAAYFPNGVAGTLQCVPYALFMFLGVEQATLAGSEMRNMRRDLPRALIVAIVLMVCIAMAVLVLSTGAAGIERLAPSEDPLLTVLSLHAERAGSQWLTQVVGLGALCALLSTFFSLVYASSRQFFHLAAAGDLPAGLSAVNGRGAPGRALGLVGLLAAVASAFAPDAVIVVVIFMISVAYLLLVASFISLRRRHTQLSPGYQAIGGLPLSLLTGALSIGVLASCFYLQTQALSFTVAAIAALYAYARFLKHKH